jgi:D-serine deaminase-like pyridoxal phosphate-dependent protein
MNTEWFTIENVHEVDSPALVVYPSRVLENIHTMKSHVRDFGLLRPHVKTHKSLHVTKLLLQEGISKFKCATIAEAEMLGMAGAPDVLLAYQPTGPKVERLADLVYEYPATTYSCLVDNSACAEALASAFNRYKLKLPVFIDINVGMNRTGTDCAQAEVLYKEISRMEGLSAEGLHAYDGHLRDSSIEERTSRCNAAFEPVAALQQRLVAQGFRPVVVAGGSPTFPIHAKRGTVECSPGTFVYWDAGYGDGLPDLPFLHAALVVTRIVSQPTPDTVCIDLGHKSIASENPIERRVRFLNVPGLVPVSHSEEHMVLRNTAGVALKPGEVLYGLPYHICPTCALYDAMLVVKNGHAHDRWNITARGRRISI